MHIEIQWGIILFLAFLLSWAGQLALAATISVVEEITTRQGAAAVVVKLAKILGRIEVAMTDATLMAVEAVSLKFIWMLRLFITNVKSSK